MPKTKQSRSTKPAHKLRANWRRTVEALRRFRRTQAGQLTILWAIGYGVLVGFLCSSVLENYNYLEFFPEQLILPLAMHAVTALILALLLFRLPWLPSLEARMVSVFLLALCMTGYDDNLQVVADLVRAFTPGLTGFHALAPISIVYFVLLVALATLLGRGIANWATRFRHIQGRDLQLGIGVLVAYLVIVPAFGLLQMVPSILSQAKVQASEFGNPKGQPDPAKPDVYYIVLDRYASNPVLSEQFGYDNSGFTNFLKDSGFTVNDYAAANYPYTAISVASTMTADYTNKLVEPFKNNSVQSRTLYHNLIWSSPVAKAIKQAGYQYHTVGSTYGATYKAPLADTNHTWQYNLDALWIHKRLRGIEAIAFQRSPYHQLAQINIDWWPLKFSAKSEVEYLNEQLSALDQLSQAPQQGGRFIFAHLLIPHEPFYFNADGSLSTHPEADNVGATVKDKYTGQITYINSYLQELVKRIGERSGGRSIVVLNADEGPYPQVMDSTVRKPLQGAQSDDVIRGDMRSWPDEWLRMKYGILQAIHIPGARADDLSKLSSVNVFRIVLNRHFGYELPYLPECHYGLTAGSRDEFLYADITGRFRPEPDPSCQAMQSQK